jgi:hypothetical protein
MLIVLKLLYAWLLPPGIFLLAIAAMYGYMGLLAAKLGWQ